VSSLQEATRSFFLACPCASPKTNPQKPHSVRRWFQAHDWRFSRPIQRPLSIGPSLIIARSWMGKNRKQVVACVSTGDARSSQTTSARNAKIPARAFGVCVQLCGGARLSWTGPAKIQSIPEYIPNLPQDEYPGLDSLPARSFRYISAHELLYSDMAKCGQTGPANVSPGPGGIISADHKIARMVRDQLSMGPLKAIRLRVYRCRLSRWLPPSYVSMRLGIADALAESCRGQILEFYTTTSRPPRRSCTNCCSPTPPRSLHPRESSESVFGVPL